MESILIIAHVGQDFMAQTVNLLIVVFPNLVKMEELV